MKPQTEIKALDHAEYKRLTMTSEQHYALEMVKVAAETRADEETHECNDVCESGGCPYSNAQECLDEAVIKLVFSFTD